MYSTLSSLWRLWYADFWRTDSLLCLVLHLGHAVLFHPNSPNRLLFLWDLDQVPLYLYSDVILCLSQLDQYIHQLMGFCAQTNANVCRQRSAVIHRAALKMFLCTPTQFTFNIKTFVSKIWRSAQRVSANSIVLISLFVESTHLLSVCSFLNVENIKWVAFLGQMVKHRKPLGGFFV